MLIDTMFARDIYQVYEINNDWLNVYLSQFVCLLGSTLWHACWITESKDNWSLVKRSHVFNELFSEGSGNGSSSNGNSWLQFTTDLFKTSQRAVLFDKGCFVDGNTATGTVLK